LQTLTDTIHTYSEAYNDGLSLGILQRISAVDNPTLWFKLLEFVLNNQQVPSAHPFRAMDSLQLREHHRVRGEEEGNRASDPRWTRKWTRQAGDKE
jgi:hypothetical protein